MIDTYLPQVVFMWSWYFLAEIFTDHWRLSKHCKGFVGHCIHLYGRYPDLFQRSRRTPYFGQKGFTVARRRGSILKPEKCFFEKPSIEYLSMIISQDKIQMNPRNDCTSLTHFRIGHSNVPQRRTGIHFFSGFILADYHAVIFDGMASRKNISPVSKIVSSSRAM